MKKHDLLDEAFEEFGKMQTLLKTAHDAKHSANSTGIKAPEKRESYLVPRIKYMEKLARVYLKEKKQMDVDDVGYRATLDVINSSHVPLYSLMAQSAISWDNATIRKAQAYQMILPEQEMVCAVFLIETAREFFRSLQESLGTTVTAKEMRLQMERVALIEVCFTGFRIGSIRQDAVAENQGLRKKAGTVKNRQKIVQVFSERMKNKDAYVWKSDGARKGSIHMRRLAEDMVKDLRALDPPVVRPGVRSLYQRQLPKLLKLWEAQQKLSTGP